MPTTEDASPSRWPWLDWWFAPRWRALLTWLVLVALMQNLYDIVGMDGIESVTRWPFDLINGFSPWRFPDFVIVVTENINYALLWCWFEPFVLRLNLLRGVAWIGLRIAPMLIIGFLLPSYGLYLRGPYALLWTVAAMAVLWRWRSRPWMSIIGGLLLFAISNWEIPGLRKLPDWFRSPVFALPYAAVLLYGTRRLTPEEREQRRS